MDLYGEELRVWRECWRDRDREGGGEVKDVSGEMEKEGGKGEKKRAMPGTFDW